MLEFSNCSRHQECQVQCSESITSLSSGHSAEKIPSDSEEGYGTLQYVPHVLNIQTNTNYSPLPFGIPDGVSITNCMQNMEGSSTQDEGIKGDANRHSQLESVSHLSAYNTESLSFHYVTIHTTRV